MKAKLRFLTFLSLCGDLGVWHLISTCMTIVVGGTRKIKMTSASSDAPNISKAPRRTPLNDLLCEVECAILIQDLEQRLRSQIEKIEHLKLFMAEALSSSSSSGGFKTKEHQCGDLKMSVAEHAAFLNDLNARTEALQTSISIFMQCHRPFCTDRVSKSAAITYYGCGTSEDLWPGDDSSKVLQPLCFLFLVLCSMGFYFAVSLMDPGYVMSDCDEKFQLLDVNEDPNITGLQSSTPVRLRRCGYCLFKQPMRARHCKSCQRCVRRFDHHCPWIENCVGEKNHATFILYLCVQLMALLWAFHLGWSGFHFEETWTEWLRVNIFLLLAFVLICIFTVVVSLLLISHLYLISCNVTTWEFMSHHRIAYLKHYEFDTNPFDKGIIRNMWSFFCTYGTVAWERIYYRESCATV